MGSTAVKRILILGGGFAGLTVAMELEKTLASDPSVYVTLVNRENFFLFTPMLHEVAASDLDLARRDRQTDRRRQYLGDQLFGVYCVVALAHDLSEQYPAIGKETARCLRLDT